MLLYICPVLLNATIYLSCTTKCYYIPVCYASVRMPTICICPQVCGRLLVLSERERLRVASPIARQHHQTLAARLRMMERKAHVLAQLALHDASGMLTHADVC